ncbi:hypothetical protein GN244_ATG15052 [Phytophthora infestans]|uniref:Transmembrane protein n=1 Tax=Phytophthora infestans TaxID=4787 RepID=A0A833SMM5_PHYIN|nr:hypothetical protein GN244_ATG15052 [Phytophthora infestans]
MTFASARDPVALDCLPEVRLLCLRTPTEQINILKELEDLNIYSSRSSIQTTATHFTNKQTRMTCETPSSAQMCASASSVGLQDDDPSASERFVLTSRETRWDFNTVGNIPMLSALEIVSFVAFHLLLKRKFVFSPIYQLACSSQHCLCFRMNSNISKTASKTRVLLVRVLTPIVYCGRSISFTFEWLPLPHFNVHGLVLNLQLTIQINKLLYYFVSAGISAGYAGCSLLVGFRVPCVEMYRMELSLEYYLL